MMNYHDSPKSLPAPCIVERGTIVNKDDIKRLLQDITWVRYIYTIDNCIDTEGKGRLKEVFINSCQSTMIANGNLYINIQSFDYLELGKSLQAETYFDLIQENCQLRLIPISRSCYDPSLSDNIDEVTLEVMVAEALSAHLDVRLDDEKF
ncbi:hypothetical protein [Myxosarcina sp. GI1(2024)]